MPDPQASRPRFSPVYGVPANEEGLLPWSWLEARMADAKHYWLGTVTPEGSPHSRPVDGMWVDRGVYFGGTPESKWWRNLLANDKASIHLEDAEKAVILEGNVRFFRPGDVLAERLAAESNRKYEMGQTGANYQLVDIAEFLPRRVLGWNVLSEDATRWQLD